MDFDGLNAKTVGFGWYVAHFLDPFCLEIMIYCQNIVLRYNPPRNFWEYQ